MSPNTHAILSELHKLLSTYNLNDFREAKNYSGISRNMREALDALCREADPRRRIEHSKEQQIPELRAKSRSISAEGSTTKLDAKDDILSAIRHSAYFENMRSLVSFCRNAGVRLQSRPKESKDKFAKRIANAIQLLPEGRREEVTSKLKSSIKSQTEGWIDVIRNTSHE